MIFRALLFFSLLTSSAIAQALDLNGSWTGSKGIQTSSSINDQEGCSNFIFNFRQTESELELLNGEVSCHIGPQQYLPFIAKINDGHLTSENPDFSGEILKDMVIATWQNPNENYKFTMVFKLVNGKIHYSDIAITYDGTKWVKTEGILQK
jgi:hypothetical protein